MRSHTRAWPYNTPAKGQKFVNVQCIYYPEVTFNHELEGKSCSENGEGEESNTYRMCSIICKYARVKGEKKGLVSSVQKREGKYKGHLQVSRINRLHEDSEIQTSI